MTHGTGRLCNEIGHEGGDAEGADAALLAMPPDEFSTLDRKLTI